MLPIFGWHGEEMGWRQGVKRVYNIYLYRMSLADYKEVSTYYDKLWAELETQNKAGVNIRHLTILKNLKREGLGRNSKVLEIGCGIGTLTKLIAKNLGNGKIVGVDISPETI